MKSIRELSWAGHYWAGKEAGEVMEQLSGAENEIALDVGGYNLQLTQLNRVYWPGEAGDKAVTKRDYLSYLVSVSPCLIKHLKQRPVTLTLYPHGATGAWSFHRHWEEQVPPFVDMVNIFTEHSYLDKSYVMCNNLATLLWFGEVANLELRPWFSRVETEPDARKLLSIFTGSAWQLNRSVLNYPDFMIFDLDPYFCSSNETEDREADRIAFQRCCEVAFWLKEILESLSLPPRVKTSGRARLHLFVPILRNMDYPHVRSAAAAIAWLMLQEHPQDVTTEWSVAKRTGKVLLDYNQNLLGKTVPWVYSPTTDQGALVSMPVRWDELEGLNPADFTMEAARDRLQSEGDLWGSILDEKVDMSHMYMPPV